MQKSLLSRRLLRIKVMQVIYAASFKADESEARLRKMLEENIQHSLHALLYQFVFISQLADAIEKEAEIKASKYLPTEEDKSYSTKLQDNLIIEAFREDDELQAYLKKARLLRYRDDNLVRLMLNKLKQHPEYKAYTRNNERSFEEDRHILTVLLEELLWPDENYNQYMEDLFASWQDDDQSIMQKVQQLLAQLSKKNGLRWSVNTLQMDEAGRQFSLKLLIETLKNQDYFDGLIADKLQNWELNRITLMDKILMKMALTELLCFADIPVKVSINEYVDIAKYYSSPKSKDFINGILDKIMKEMKEKGKIIKTGRGLVE